MSQEPTQPARKNLAIAAAAAALTLAAGATLGALLGYIGPSKAAQPALAQPPAAVAAPTDNPGAAEPEIVVVNEPAPRAERREHEEREHEERKHGRHHEHEDEEEGDDD